MQFTGAAKVLGGEMYGLMRPKLGYLAAAGLGASVATASASSMSDRGVSVKNTLGLAAGGALAFYGGKGAGLSKLMTASGQRNLAGKVIASGNRMADAGHTSMARTALGMGKSLLNSSNRMGSTKVAKAAATTATDRVWNRWESEVRQQSIAKKLGMFPGMPSGPLDLDLPAKKPLMIEAYKGPTRGADFLMVGSSPATSPTRPPKRAPLQIAAKPTPPPAPPGPLAPMATTKPKRSRRK